MKRRTALYRFFRHDDALLYIGITEDPKTRFGRHRSDKAWWPDVARHTIEWHETRDLALAAEVAAIKVEQPIWNVAGSPCPPEKPIAPWFRKLKESGDVISLTEAKKRFERLVLSVRDDRRLVVLVGHGKPRALLAPVEFGDAVEAVGGADTAAQILRDHVHAPKG